MKKATLLLLLGAASAQELEQQIKLSSLLVGDADDAAITDGSTNHKTISTTEDLDTSEKDTTAVENADGTVSKKTASIDKVPVDVAIDAKDKAPKTQATDYSSTEFDAQCTNSAFPYSSYEGKFCYA
jgi:hypothetical protein